MSALTIADPNDLTFHLKKERRGKFLLLSPGNEFLHELHQRALLAFS